jgi:hypothetical protein
MPNLYTYEFTDRRGSRVLVPAGEYNMKKEYKQLSDGRRDYAIELTGDLVFAGGDFQWLLELERSVYRSENNGVLITEMCDGETKQFFKGRINFSDGHWHLDKCILKIKATAIDPYTTYDDNKEKVLNLFQLVPDRKSVFLNEPGVTFEFLEFDSADCNPQPLWAGVGTPEDGAWQWYYNFYHTLSGACSKTTKWVREKKTITCAESLGAPWVLIADTCPGGNKVYVRKASLYDNHVDRIFDPVTGEFTLTDQYKIFGYDSPDQTIDNGMSLSDILIALMNACSLTIKSDFFQINPDVVSDINYVTGQSSSTNHVIVWQKSDVKRPNVSNNATLATFTPEKMITELVEIFNLEWKITGAELRLEHTSFFVKNPGLDLSIPRYTKDVFFRREYTYDKQKLPRRENYLFTEAFATYGDFYGFPIVYNNANANQGPDAIKDHRVEDFMTDVLFCLQNPDPNSKAVSDSGFLIGSCGFDGANYFFNRRPPIVDSYATPNNPFAWVYLHSDFHKHKRPFQKGLMNNQLTTFLSVIPTKKGATVAIDFCCDDSFEPLDYITTPFGWGNAEVETASFNPHAKRLSLDLIYNAEFNLIQNTPPVANADAASVLKNHYVDIDVLANDTDDQGMDKIQGYEITSQPNHGTATIVDHIIRYVPELNYVGTDFFFYRVKDYWGEYSNICLVNVSVINDPAYPVANPDSYLAEKDVVLLISGGAGVLANDTDDLPGLVAVAETKPTAQGGSVTISADGSFAYTPAPGFVGTDSFEYTNQDTDGHQSSAAVTILVRQPVFAQLVEFNSHGGTTYQDCNGTPSRTVYTSYASYKVKFFEDAGASIPLDVTGYGIVAKVQRHIVISPGSIDETPTFNFDASGMEVIVFVEVLKQIDDSGCEGVGEYHESSTFTLLPNGYTVI